MHGEEKDPEYTLKGEMRRAEATGLQKRLKSGADEDKDRVGSAVVFFLSLPHMPPWVKRPMRSESFSEEKKLNWGPLAGDCCLVESRIMLQCSRMDLRAKKKESCEWESLVVVKRDSDLQTLMAESLMSLRAARRRPLGALRRRYCKRRSVERRCEGDRF